MVGLVRQDTPLDSRDAHLEEEKYDESDQLRSQSRSGSLLAKYLPYEPQTYQLDGMCPTLDGYDFLASTP
jgi:hypothetical protein